MAVTTTIWRTLVPPLPTSVERAIAAVVVALAFAVVCSLFFATRVVVAGRATTAQVAVPDDAARAAILVGLAVVVTRRVAL